MRCDICHKEVKILDMEIEKNTHRLNKIKNIKINVCQDCSNKICNFIRLLFLYKGEEVSE